MNYRIPQSIWKDIRQNISEYSSDELLEYYRAAKCFAFSKEAQEREGVSPDMCRKIFQRVDSIISTMKYSTDYRVTIMAKILEIEFCAEPIESAAKITAIGVSKSTYYAYYHEAKKIFSSMVKALNQFSE